MEKEFKIVGTKYAICVKGESMKYINNDSGESVGVQVTDAEGDLVCIANKDMIAFVNNHESEVDE